MIFSGNTGSRIIQFVESLRINNIESVALPFNSGIESFTEISGAVFRESTGATKTNYQFQVNSFGGAQSNLVSWSSSAPEIGAINSSGFLTHVNDGQVEITARFGRSSISTGINLQTQQGTTVRSLFSYSNNTLGADATNSIDSLLIAGKQKELFSIRDNTGVNYQRNTGFWGSGIDLGCLSVWNSQSGPRRGGTLISPRHVLFSAHYPISNGSVLRFVNNQNQVFSGVVANSSFHPNYNPLVNLANDIQVAVLNQDITGVNFAKIMPVFSGKHVTNGFERNLASFVVNSERKGLIYDYGFTNSENYSFFTNPVSINKDIRNNFFEGMVAGDSGSPAFFLLSGQPILIGTATYGGATSMQCSFLGTQTQTINSMMTALGGGYQLSTFNISGYQSV